MEHEVKTTETNLTSLNLNISGNVFVGCKRFTLWQRNNKFSTSMHVLRL